MGVHYMSKAVLACSILAALTVPALSDGDAAAGKKVFNKCKACHSIDEEKNKVGPHLVGLVGRTAGTVEDFKYSDAMKESGIVWTAETLAPYLEKPKDVVPGTKMAFAGLKKPEDIANLIAYIEEESKPDGD